MEEKSGVKTRAEDLMIALQSPVSERWQPSACGLVCSWSICNGLCSWCIDSEVLCQILQHWWKDGTCYFCWSASTPSNVLCKDTSNVGWCPQNAASGTFLIRFFWSSWAVIAKTNWQGSKYDGVVLHSHVGNGDTDHGFQARGKEVKEVGKWKLLNLEQSLCVRNYLWV